jgi:putative transposase
VRYTGDLYAKACRNLGVIQSMGRVDSVLDDAAAEAFNSIIKVEYIHRQRRDQGNFAGDAD